MPLNLSSMTLRLVLICYLSLLGTCLFLDGSTLAASPLQDQPEVVQQDEMQAEPLEAGDADEAEEAAEEVNPQAAVLANMGLNANKTRAAKRFVLKQAFQVEVEELTRILELDSKQQKKLSVAGKGAAKKLLARWSEKRGLGQNPAKDSESEAGDEEVEITDADQIDEQTLMMMDMNDRGNPFSGTRPQQNPVWKKMLTKVLTAEQLATLKAFRAKQAERKKEAQVATMMQILSAELGLSSAQSDELQRLIRPHVDAAKPVSMALYDMFLTLYYASKVDEVALQKLLSKAQHQKWKLLMVPMQQIGQMLEQQDEAEQVVEE